MVHYDRQWLKISYEWLHPFPVRDLRMSLLFNIGTLVLPALFLRDFGAGLADSCPGGLNPAWTFLLFVLPMAPPLILAYGFWPSIDGRKFIPRLFD
jgi:hypothetical protein